MLKKKIFKMCSQMMMKLKKTLVNKAPSKMGKKEPNI